MMEEKKTESRVSKTMAEHARKTKAQLDADVQALDELALKIEDLELDIDAMSTVERLCDGLKIWLRRDLKKNEHMNEVASYLLRDLAKAGIHLSSDKGNNAYTDFAAIGRREWDLADGKVLLALFVCRDEGAKCRYVETGTTVEKCYKIVCDEPSVGPETVREVLSDSTPV